MRLYEFVNPLIPKLIAVSDQIKDDLANMKLDADNMTVDELLQYLQKYDITLSPGDLRDMIQKPPMNRLISNIEGDKIVFKGNEKEDDQSEDEKQQVVKSMADKAMNQAK